MVNPAFFFAIFSTLFFGQNLSALIQEEVDPALDDNCQICQEPLSSQPPLFQTGCCGKFFGANCLLNYCCKKDAENCISNQSCTKLKSIISCTNCRVGDLNHQDFERLTTMFPAGEVSKLRTLAFNKALQAAEDAENQSKNRKKGKK